MIERDIDGANSLPLRLDGEVPNLGKYGACRRVARSIFLGSAPIPAAANQGIEDRRIKLGCVIPGEPAAVFGDAMRRLGSAATYLYQDGARYWYSTQPTVANLAESRAEECRRNRDKVDEEIGRRLREDLNNRGDFNKVHILPSSGHDVQDDQDASLVVLGPTYPHTREGGSDSRAITAAKSILESRGNTPRLFRNTLAFLAARAFGAVRLSAIASVGGSASNGYALWVWEGSPVDDGVCWVDFKLSYSDDYGATFTEAAVVRGGMGATATEYRYSVATVPEMSIVSQLQVQVCAPDAYKLPQIVLTQEPASSRRAGGL